MRAKTKTSVIKWLCVLMGAVFAFIIGNTYGLSALSMTEFSNPKSTTAYMAKQGYSVINDTKNNPIPFGVGSHNYEVAIQYSFSYSFDLRIKYSLNWTNSRSANNVILNYANRDNFIVDEDYIYVRDAVANAEDETNNKGKLTIFTGVDFDNPEDETYIGESLTIEIEEVKIYKTQPTYTNQHNLYLNNPAGEAWLKYKNNSSIAGAYAMVYNHRCGTASDLSRGIDFPGDESAYYKEITTESGYTAVTAAKWLGGQKFYAGIGAYIITGNSPISLKARPLGSWLGESASSQFDNNIRFNFSSDWKYSANNLTSYQNSTFLSNQEGYYTLTIPANSAVYIDIIDSIEITSVGVLAPKQINNIKLIASLILNDVTFNSGEYLQTGTIANSVVATSGSYAQNAVDVINTTNYNNGLYDFTNGTLTESYSQTFTSHMTLINNTANKIKPTINYSLRYYISNGATTLNVPTESVDLSSSYWYRVVGTTSNYFNVLRNTNYDYIAPYSSHEIMVEYTISAGFKQFISSTYGNYDVWVEIVPTILNQANSSNATQLDVLASISENNVTFSVKNNSLETVSGTVSANLEMYKSSFDYMSVSVEPADWLANYWRYYYLEGGVYKKYNTATITSGDDVLSTFNSSNCYVLYITRASDLVSIASPTMFNGFTKSGSQYTATLTLQPGESCKILTTAVGANDVDKMLTFVSTAEATQTTAPNTIDIVNEKSGNDAYIINNSQNSYYVRFSGVYAGNNDNIVNINGWNYYIGIVRPNQIIDLPLSSTSTLETLQAGETYNTTDMTWSDATETFNDYYD